MKRAWITGAGGLIGSYVLRNAPRFAPEWDARGWMRSELDLTDRAAVEAQFRAAPPQLIIHCAALSKSPECQTRPALARKINVEATEHLAALARDIRFIFFSTDLVFDGRQGGYVETDPVHPLSVYAETKAEAEEIVARNPRHAIVRTSLNSGASPRGDTAYNEQLLAAWRVGQPAKLFVDEFRCPISASVTARAIWELSARGEGGLFHLAGSQRLSRLEIGRLLAARHPEVTARMEPASLREYAGAPRPPDTSLNCAKIQRLLSFELPGLAEWLAENPADFF